MGGGAFYTLIARTEIVESTKIVAVEAVNTIPKIIFLLIFNDCGGWDRLITGMLFQSLGKR